MPPPLSQNIPHQKVEDREEVNLVKKMRIYNAIQFCT